QLSRDAQGELVGKGDMAEQTRQAIRNMRTVLEAAGGTLDDIVSIVVYTTDMRTFKDIVQARTFFSPFGSPRVIFDIGWRSFQRVAFYHIPASVDWYTGLV